MSTEEGTTLLPGEPPLTIHWRRSARARRLSLRVSGLDGKVTLTLPQRVAMRHGQAFLEERAAWLRRSLAAIPPPCPVSYGSQLPVEGMMRQVTAHAGRQIALAGECLLVPESRDPGRRIAGWLKLRARARIAAGIEQFAPLLGSEPRRLSLRDPRSRWGSCTAAGDLMFSWRLILAPPVVLDYVVAHEMAHLRQMNHSPAFWSEVARLMPDYTAPRDWLRSNGAGLHRYRFAPA